MCLLCCLYTTLAALVSGGSGERPDRTDLPGTSDVDDDVEAGRPDEAAARLVRLRLDAPGNDQSVF